jgi:hypothetical protein
MKFRRIIFILQVTLVLASLSALPVRSSTGPTAELEHQFTLLAPTPLTFGPAYLPARKLDRKAIVKYAYDWSDKKRRYNNPAYRTFNNDCTNFVSQALRAGGWADVGPSVTNLIYPRRDRTEWWYLSRTPRDNWGQSWSWTEANSFFQFINISGRADFTIKLNLLQPGDIVQADWEYDFHVNHSMIVTKKDKNDIYLTYHSGADKGKPEQDMPLSELKKKHPKGACYGFRLRDSL